jgi:hypothetical protein
MGNQEAMRDISTAGAGYGAFLTFRSFPRFHKSKLQ